jgi:diaminopimelate epimerase
VALAFTKMHGLGNDYVYVDTFTQDVAQPVELARRISDRHRGVGSDGLILVGPPDGADADVRMIMYNADGSRAEMCGNGIRCVARLAYERGWATGNPLRVQTDSGVRTLDLTLDDQQRVHAVRVDMGPPGLHAADIPAKIDLDPVVGYPLELDGVALAITCVSMGNPHAIAFVDDLAAVPLERWGPALEHHALFPERINAHFVRIVNRERVEMITWERGTGPTQACGTGASAVCVAGVLNGVTERRIVARLPGGELTLEWEEGSGHVFMTGPAEEVFTGTWPQ